jgi:hypothetical protein
MTTTDTGEYRIETDANNQDVLWYYRSPDDQQPQPLTAKFVLGKLDGGQRLWNAFVQLVAAGIATNPNTRIGSYHLMGDGEFDFLDTVNVTLWPQSEPVRYRLAIAEANFSTLAEAEQAGYAAHDGVPA